MGSVDNGNQVLSYDYKEQGTSENFNKINYRLIPHGVFSGGAITRVDDTNVLIAPLVCFFEDTTNSVGVRIETTTNATLVVSATNMYIVARFVWQNTEDNYMDFLALPFASILSTDSVLGKLTFSGAVLSGTIDYSRKNWAMPYYVNGLRESGNTDTYNPPFKVIATAPYSTSVQVYKGKAIVGGKIISISSLTTSPSFTLPTSSNGRKDILTITDAGVLSIITGTDTVGAPTPNIPVDVLPIARINFPALASVVQGDYIEYLNPMFTPLLPDSDTTVQALNSDTVDNYHAGNSSGQVPISNGTVNTNLNADLLDGYTTGNLTGRIPLSNGTVNTNLNSDMLDGFHAGNATRNVDLVADMIYSATGTTNRYAGNASNNVPVSNGTVNTNLNADLLDGYHAGVSSGQIPINNGILCNNLNANLLNGYLSGNSSSQIPISNGTVNNNLNADRLDGYHAGNTSGAIPINNGTRNTNLIADQGYDISNTTGRLFGNASGNIPMSNAVLNTNLIADMLDSYHAGNSSSQIPVSNGTVNTNLNADLLDGYHAGNASGNVPISNGTTCVNLNASLLVGYSPGTTTGKLAINNGTVNTNLNSDMLDGAHASTTATLGNIPIWTTFSGQTTLLGWSQYAHGATSCLYLDVTNVQYGGSLSATPSSVAIRNSSGNILANQFIGDWMPTPRTYGSTTLAHDDVIYLSAGLWFLQMDLGEGVLGVQYYNNSSIGVSASYWHTVVSNTDYPWSLWIYSSGGNGTNGSVKVTAYNSSDSAILTWVKYFV
jgi:hypothetical protein